MALYHRVFRCEVLTMDGPVVEADAVAATFPASDGMIGVLGKRAPLITGLAPGAVTFEAPAGEKSYFVTGGFARMQEDVLSILAEQCVSVDEITLDAAKKELEQATEVPPAQGPAGQRRRQGIAVATAKVRVAERRARAASK